MSAKRNASSAASTSGAGHSRRLFGRAFAHRAASSGIDGSGAPSGRLRPRARLVLLALAIASLTLAFGATLASGEPKRVIDVFGEGGSEAGQFSSIASVGVNQTSGDVYVLDTNNARVQQFDAGGAFIRTWGWDVVASGPGDAPLDERQTVTVAADAGTFTLTFMGATTDPIAATASAATVQTELNALSSIGGEGASVTVTGGPGSPSGASPYVVTFDSGIYAGADVEQMTVEATTLSTAVGQTLSCTPTSTGLGAGNPDVAVQWLRDGVVIPGATTRNYTTVAADAGEPLQCRTVASLVKLNSNIGAVQFSSPRTVISPFPATSPPVAPQTIPAPTPAKPVSGTLETCDPNAGGWTGSPTFTYQWYRNGLPIGGATGSTYLTQGADAAASLQCAVTGVNAGGSATRASENRITQPPPLNSQAPDAEAFVSRLAKVVTTNGGGGNTFEICEPANGDTCQGGQPGEGIGQLSLFDRAQIAVAPDGSVYVADSFNLRVLKFTASGSYVSQIGGPDTGLFDYTMGVTVDPSNGDLLVGSFDFGSEIKIQRFSAGGLFKFDFGKNSHGLGDGQISGFPRLATDSTGATYALGGLTDDKRVTKFDAAGNFVELLAPEQLDAVFVTDLAVDPTTDHVFVAQRDNESDSETEILEFDATGAFVENHNGAGGGPPRGLAVRGSTGLIYLGDGEENHVFIVGDNVPPAGATIDPVSDFETRSATFSGSVNPEGVPTSYRFEYSTDGSNWTPVTPNQDIGEGVVAVPVEDDAAGLLPSTLYQVRLVVVKSKNGTPIGSATAAVSFTTKAEPPAATTLATPEVGANDATLYARINPANLQTSYRFEYGLTDQYGTSIPIPDAVLAASSDDQIVKATVPDLQPETVYHYRVVAENSEGEDLGEDVTFQTRAALTPPPKRAFEMVTPPFKTTRSTVAFGGSVGANANPGFPSKDGERLGWTIPIFPLTDDVKSAGDGDNRIITRTPQGWSWKTMNTLLMFNKVDGVPEPWSTPIFSKQGGIASSGDLGTVAWYIENGELLPSEGDGWNEAYIRREGTGTAGFTAFTEHPETQGGVGSEVGPGGHSGQRRRHCDGALGQVPRPRRGPQHAGARGPQQRHPAVFARQDDLQAAGRQSRRSAQRPKGTRQRVHRHGRRRRRHAPAQWRQLRGGRARRYGRRRGWWSSPGRPRVRHPRDRDVERRAADLLPKPEPGRRIYPGAALRAPVRLQRRCHRALDLPPPRCLSEPLPSQWRRL